MNLNALFDVSTQRSAVPLDRAVGEGGSDPAFANVMSRCQAADSDSLTQRKADSKTAPIGTESDGSSTGGVASMNPGANGVVADPPSSPTTADSRGSGDVLPVLIGPDGQSLPPAVGVAAGLRLESSASSGDGRPKSDDDPDAIDTGEATLLAAQLPVPPSAPTTLGGTTATAPVPPLAVVDASAPRHTAIAGASTPAVPTGAELSSASAVADELPQPRAPTLADHERLDDVDAVTKAAYSAALTKAAPANGSQSSDASDLRTGSSAAMARAFGQAPTADGGNRSTDFGAGQQGNPQEQPDAALPGEGAPRVVTARFAAALSSAALNDATDMPPDVSVESTPTDAIAQRANTSDAARDLAPTRLAELAQQHAPRLAGELADRVLVLRGQRFDSATVILEPRDLGRIDIQVRLQADATHISFTAQHASVRDALEGQLPRLRALLEEAGLSLGMVDVSQSGNRSGGDAPGASRSPEAAKQTAASNGDATDSSIRWHRRVEASIIDLHA